MLAGKTRGGSRISSDGPFCLFRSHCVDAYITGSDANRLFDGGNKYLSIAYVAGLRAFSDRQNRFVQFVVLQDNLDHHLWKEIGHVGVAVE